ncbi:hypothetical protein SLA2020_444750 [Shorea laevis]
MRLAVAGVLAKRPDLGQPGVASSQPRPGRWPCCGRRASQAARSWLASVWPASQDQATGPAVAGVLAKQPDIGRVANCTRRIPSFGYWRDSSSVQLERW